MERDPLVDEETRAAAAEAGAIGGSVPGESSDPARAAVEQAGGGESEGFEQAEQQLIDAAEHGKRLRDPGSDAFTAEAEADPAGGGEVYGEADHERTSEREGQQQ